MNNWISDIGNILLTGMLFIILCIHLQWGKSQTNRINKVLVILSFLLFVMIFAEQIYYSRKKEELREKEPYELTEKQIIRFKTNSIFNQDNNASRLISKIMNHPIFYM